MSRRAAAYLASPAKRPWHNHKPSQRSRPHSGALLVLAVIAGACQLAITEPVDPWQLQKTSSTASLRGLSPVDCLCAYVSGSRGTVLRTVDGGGTWESIGPVGKQALDFRSVYALDAQHAWIANAGSPAQIYRTSDGGRSWALVHEDRRAAAFFDAMAFCDAQHGLVFGDPIDGRMELLATADGGEHWRALESPELPVAQVGEAAFAASGTCLVARKAATFVQVTGGAVARCFCTDDGGLHWQVTLLPMAQGSPSQGAFAIALDSGSHLVAVGGDYQAPEVSAGTAAWSGDGGKTFHAANAGGFRCGVAYLAGCGKWLAVGDLGSSISSDGGKHWRTMPGAGFYAVRCGRDGSVWACGSGGRVALLSSESLAGVR
ncbi:MAG: oxidoreductase [Planctomycetes bacterium]|nr:oxidoreductase [Planctomycetota bacterium]